MSDREPRRIEFGKGRAHPGDNVIDELIGLVCYYYPSYTFREAGTIPLKRIRSLLKIARQQEAIRYKNLTQIVAAPHSKKGAGVKKLIKHYDKIIKTG